jgi:hypothetical protein
MQRLALRDHIEITTLCQHECCMSKQFKVARQFAGDLTHPFGNDAALAQGGCIKCEHAVGFGKIETPHNDRFGSV